MSCMLQAVKHRVGARSLADGDVFTPIIVNVAGRLQGCSHKNRSDETSKRSDERLCRSIRKFDNAPFSRKKYMYVTSFSDPLHYRQAELFVL